ncbi:MAG: cupin domain-containing protein [Thermomicrobiales bacterium]
MNVTSPVASTNGSNRSTIQPYLSELDDNAGRWFLGCRVWLRAEAAQTGGGFGLIEQLVPPGLGSPYHVHYHEDEAFYMLDGAIRIFSEGRSWAVGAGGFAFLPRGIPHGFRTEGDVPSRSLLIANPGGFEGFVAELSSVEPPLGPPNMDALMAAAGRYGLEILGPLPE